MCQPVRRAPVSSGLKMAVSPNWFSSSDTDQINVSLRATCGTLATDWVPAVGVAAGAPAGAAVAAAAGVAPPAVGAAAGWVAAPAGAAVAAPLAAGACV